MRCPDACPCSLPRGTGAVYKKRAGVVSRHHDDTMMRDENRVKKCEKYLILLNKLAGVVQWQNGSFPSCIRGFDSLRPLQPCASDQRKARLPRITRAVALPSSLPSRHLIDKP